MLRVSEIFHSIEGEGGAAGRSAVFVRLTGCPLRCVWCDTEHAFYGGRAMEIDEVLAAVRAAASPLEPTLVTVTGGEPIVQADTPLLCREMLAKGWEVRLETSGAYDVGLVPPPVVRVVDFKAPGSGEAGRNFWENLDHLEETDEVKVVVASRADFDWAVREVFARSPLPPERNFVQPVWGEVAPDEVRSWIDETNAPARMSVQLNKYLGLP